MKNIPGPAFNLVKGLKDGGEEAVDEIIDFYSSKEIPVRLELTPSHASPALLKFLHNKGFYQCDFHTTMFAEPSYLVDSPINSAIEIRKLKKHEFNLFGDIYTKGFGMPDFLKNGISENNEVLFDSSNWSFYLAYLGNEPAGIGVLYMKNGIATLAAAATISGLRNKGVQSALIQARIYQAITHNCSLITGQARFGSISQNNMEKAGLKIAYTKAIWIKDYI
ncbi:hypothetical protein [Bacillus sp. ISL-47]|uniref:hypothetical protein n=1 Tax=Bacillus sp. ISL-47 TaxID=2819130 RepID=UPI001BE751CE|nr:hypothetical protein [Pseudomonas sp. ISL-84]